MLVNKVNTFLKKSIYFVLSAILCISLITSFALPAAAGSSGSSVSSSPVTKGEANLNEIQAQTDDLAQREPANLEEIQKLTGEGGLNEAQGTKDIDKMISPEDAEARGTTSLTEKIKDALTGKK